MIVRPEYWGWDHFQCLLLIDKIIQRKKHFIVAPNKWFRVRPEIFAQMGWKGSAPSTAWSRDRWGDRIPNHDDWQVVRDFYECGLFFGTDILSWSMKGKVFVRAVKRWARRSEEMLPSQEEVLAALAN